MTSEESLQCDQQHQAYMQRRKDFNNELLAWFESHPPRSIARNANNIES